MMETVFVERRRLEGEIVESYSGDRIVNGVTRKPFTWRREQWIAVALRYRDAEDGRVVRQIEAFRLIARSAFKGSTLTYGARCADDDRARDDSNGFYHGVLVKHAGKECVLSGPPVLFASDPASPPPPAVVQTDLFGELK